MAIILSSQTRHETFISYHHEDEKEVSNFVNNFDHRHDVLISRGVGASMAGDVIDSKNAEYVKRRIRKLYLRGSIVTIVMICARTWGRRFVDWEIAASLRNTASSSRNGLVRITLPCMSGVMGRRAPERLVDNLNHHNGYARWHKCPAITTDLARIIEEAYGRRITHAGVANKSRQLRMRNAG